MRQTCYLIRVIDPIGDCAAEHPVAKGRGRPCALLLLAPARRDADIRRARELRRGRRRGRRGTIRWAPGEEVPVRREATQPDHLAPAHWDRSSGPALEVARPCGESTSASCSLSTANGTSNAWSADTSRCHGAGSVCVTCPTGSAGPAGARSRGCQDPRELGGDDPSRLPGVERRFAGRLPGR